MRIVHVKKEPFTIYMGRAVIGYPYRESPWHNPFRIYIHDRGPRQWAIAKFAAYFYAPEQKWLREKAFAEIPPDAVLGCWCAPEFCHSDIVAGYLEWKRGGLHG